MRKFFGIILASFIFWIGAGFFPAQVNAICYSTRSISQWACSQFKSDNTMANCPPANLKGVCASGAGDCPYGSKHSSVCTLYGSTDTNCIDVCTGWTSGDYCARTSGTVPCSGLPDCQYEGAITTCNDGVTRGDGTCETNSTTWTYGCWGPSDVTTTPGPTQDPSDSPTPIPTCTPSCNNNLISDWCETCASCPGDVCPNYTSDISVTVVNESSTNCTVIQASTAYADSAVSLSGASPGTKNTVGANPAEWTSLAADRTYVVSVNPPSNTVPKKTCLVDLNDNSVTSGYSIAVGPLGHDFHLYVAVVPGGTWSQTARGNVHANQQIISRVPVTAPQSYLSEIGAAGYPGLVSYGTSLDASLTDTNGTESGGNLSTTRWNAQATYPVQPLYEHFSLLLGGMTGTGDPLITTGELKIADFSNCGNPTHCYYGDDIAINAPLTIGANEKRVIVINGTLTINESITIASGGFLAFIVKDGITVDSGLGASPVRYNAATPLIQGMYVTDGTFSIPKSGTPPDTQLVLKGSFIANEFVVTRKLTDAQNLLYPATMFIFDPSLLFSMPLILQEVPFRWQEVAP